MSEPACVYCESQHCDTDCYACASMYGLSRPTAAEIRASGVVDAAARIAVLEQRQQELLALILRLTNETPFPDEVKDWVAQRAALVAQVGSLRARVAELERRNGGGL